MLFRRSQRAVKNHPNVAGVTSPQEATGTATVLRFQGKFECGDEWPKDELAPEECPKHPGAKRVYKVERVLDMNVEIQEEADGKS